MTGSHEIFPALEGGDHFYVGSQEAHASLDLQEVLLADVNIKGEKIYETNEPLPAIAMYPGLYAGSSGMRSAKVRYGAR
ncbi:hypothetical protein NOC27_3047 [Nitrosococcus oceani AFC27]|uniref:Uncharacterized protein n=1 Tax=Nitrosococcus oceani C-27 TaxID=314279 RepID=A0A0E2ZPS9_9GAMM|nr:hypothetical protein NOC27_3047 [Nitrosococcus oceani AFC27]KFI20392.1 hypothetical protein IB75_03255 [Nitrosococcus oceani C-27]KFI23542.1 hypothetical protein HW44_03270 [Nitrosococcus oceani]